MLGGRTFCSVESSSPGHPSYVVACRPDPPTSGVSGGPRPDDKLGLEASITTSLAQRHKLIDSGQIPHEELIRMEEIGKAPCRESELFNDAAWYVLRKVDAEWDQLGYFPQHSIG